MAQKQTPLGGCTPLRAVKDWGWHRYRVDYWEHDPEAVPGQQPLLTREFVESENGVDRFLFGYPEDDCPPEGGPWPTRDWGSGPTPGWATWTLVTENVERSLRFVSGGRLGGTRVVGAGWCAPPPPGWRGGRPVLA